MSIPSSDQIRYIISGSVTSSKFIDDNHALTSVAIPELGPGILRVRVQPSFCPGPARFASSSSTPKDVNDSFDSHRDRKVRADFLDGTKIRYEYLLIVLERKDRRSWVTDRSMESRSPRLAASKMASQSRLQPRLKGLVPSSKRVPGTAVSSFQT